MVELAVAVAGSWGPAIADFSLHLRKPWHHMALTAEPAKICAFFKTDCLILLLHLFHSELSKSVFKVALLPCASVNNVDSMSALTLTIVAEQGFVIPPSNLRASLLPVQALVVLNTPYLQSISYCTGRLART